MPISNLTLLYSDYLPLIRTHVLKQWQSSWSLETENKLHAIEPTVNETKSYRLPRRDEIIIHRLRTGHTFLTHGYLLKRDSPTRCMRAKLNSQLNTSYCIVRRGMQSVPIISPSQTCLTCSATSPHVVSLILLKKLIFIAEYDHHIVFIFNKKEFAFYPQI